MTREHREGKSWGASGRGVRSHEASKKEESKDHRIAAGHLDSGHLRPLFCIPSEQAGFWVTKVTWRKEHLSTQRHKLAY